MRARIILFLVLLAVLAGCSSAMTLTGTVSGARDNELLIKSGGPLAVVEVVSPRGIGQAAIEAVSYGLPQRILLRFKLRGLEELRLSFGLVEITASLRDASGRVSESMRQSDQKGAVVPLAAGDPFWMPIRLVPEGGAPAEIPLQAGYIEVEVPKGFFQSGERSFSFKWIDFLR